MSGRPCMSNTSTEMSFAPETWSIRPATTIESGLNTRDIASVGDTLEEDSTALLLDTPAELELGGGVTTLEDEGSELELLASEEELLSSEELLSTLDDDGVSLEELGGTSLEEDSTALLLDTLAELELGGGVTTLEDEGSELELLSSEELEDRSTTVIFPAAEVLPSTPVTAIL